MKRLALLKVSVGDNSQAGRWPLPRGVARGVRGPPAVLGLLSGSPIGEGRGVTSRCVEGGINRAGSTRLRVGLWLFLSGVSLGGVGGPLVSRCGLGGLDNVNREPVCALEAASSSLTTSTSTPRESSACATAIGSKLGLKLSSRACWSALALESSFCVFNDFLLGEVRRGRVETGIFGALIAYAGAQNDLDESERLMPAGSTLEGVFGRGGTG